MGSPDLTIKHTYSSFYSCVNGHQYIVPFKCSPKDKNACLECNGKRSRQLLAKLFYRLDKTEQLRTNITMWTFGTDIDYKRWTGPGSRRTSNLGLKWHDNLNEIISSWQKFNTRMKVYTKRSKIIHWEWNPLFYVVEAGSKGNKLHIHLLTRGYVGYYFAKKHWSDITGIPKPNVNFIQDLKKTGYISKYTSKGALAYSFLGELYKIKEPPVDKTCREVIKNKKCGEKFIFLKTGDNID